MFRKCTVLMMIAMLTQVGCYNTYNLNMDELGKLTEGGTNAAVKVQTEEGQQVVVTENTKIGITMTDGQYRPISPFNFTMTSGQLIAPDEDLLEDRGSIKTGNVKQVSGSKTALVVLTGLAAVVGGALYVTLSAEEDKGFGQ